MSLVFMKKKLFEFHIHGSLDLASVLGMFKLFVISVVTFLTSIKILEVYLCHISFALL